MLPYKQKMNVPRVCLQNYTDDKVEMARANRTGLKTSMSPKRSYALDSPDRAHAAIINSGKKKIKRTDVNKAFMKQAYGSSTSQAKYYSAEKKRA